MPDLTRRELLLLAAASAAAGASGQTPPRAAPSGRPWFMPLVKPTYQAWWLTNPFTGGMMLISSLCPTFQFERATVGGQGAHEVDWQDGTFGGQPGWRATWHVGGAIPAAIEQTLVLDHQAGLLTRDTTLRIEGTSPQLLRTVQLDAGVAPGEAPQCRPGLQNHPLLCRAFFMGVEFPIATATVTGDRYALGHSPGRVIVPGEVYRTRRAVYAACQPGQAREAFEAYIASQRPQPRGVHFNYNSWWTSPVPYSEKDILDLITAFRSNLFDRYGVSPDTFCIDMGWAKNTTLWQIDPKLFPNGFARLQEALAAIRSRPGLWISPSGCYPQALDLAWAKSAGYEADTKACLAGPRYREALARSLVDMARRYGVRHVKLDGYVPTCDAADHGHAPGALSAEAIAEGMLEVIAAVRQAAPDMWFEPTCFGFDPSPWWLPHCNSVIGSFGDDAPNGRVPCPVYRESYTTGRDYHNLKGARDIQLPIAAQEVLGIVHQTPEPLQNDAVVSVLRGHQFQPLYVNPAYMSPRRWEFLAALMQWARANQDVLAETRAILPESWRKAGGGPGIFEEAPAPREPYGYAHWRGDRGLVCLRNPWIEPATVSLSRAADLGIPAASGDLSAAMVYPVRAALSARMRVIDPLVVDLAPWETVLIELGPAGRRLPPARRTGAAPARAAPAVAVQAGRAEFEGDGPDFGADYTRRPMAPGPHLRVGLKVALRADGSGAHELLVLVEGPAPVEEPLHRFTVGERRLQPRVVSSEAGWRATGAPATEHWMWLIVPLRPGENALDAQITLASGAERLAAWVTARERLPWRRLAKVDGSVLPGPEERWLSAVPVADWLSIREGMPVEKAEAPVERIDGVYLDALDPLSAEQGWGTLQRNRSVWEKPMTIAGRRFLRGLGTHAPSRLVYALDGKWRRFRCWAGADGATGPTITMEVRVDGRSAWHSPGLVTRETPAARIDVPVAGAKRLELIVGDGGNGLAADHADWADAMLLR